jgi:guanylate kinase
VPEPGNNPESDPEGRTGVPGKLLVIDGPSAVGKSTIVRGLLNLPDLHFDIVKRYTTRQRRESDNDDDLYEFVQHPEFRRLVGEGFFLEHKCYKFGMCYGLPGEETKESLRKGHHALAMINLGNIGAVKSVLRDAYGVFVSASLETIRERLTARKTHPPGQIEERLGNAADSVRFQPLYDLVVTNENRSVEEVVEEIKNRFLLHVRTFAPRTGRSDG